MQSYLNYILRKFYIFVLFSFIIVACSVENNSGHKTDRNLSSQLEPENNELNSEDQISQNAENKNVTNNSTENPIVLQNEEKLNSISYPVVTATITLKNTPQTISTDIKPTPLVTVTSQPSTGITPTSIPVSTPIVVSSVTPDVTPSAVPVVTPIVTPSAVPVVTPLVTPPISSIRENDLNQLSELCIQLINQYRATANIPPVTRWVEGENCADLQAKLDFEYYILNGTAHHNFKFCKETLQNEYYAQSSGYFVADYALNNSLQGMFDEGPKADRTNHYETMMNKTLTKVACGFYLKSTGNTYEYWGVQDFSF